MNSKPGELFKKFQAKKKAAYKKVAKKSKKVSKKKTTKKHPGFASVQAKIAKKEGVSKVRAGAILASATRGASKAAKKANPRLAKVKGKMKMAYKRK